MVLTTIKLVPAVVQDVQVKIKEGGNDFEIPEKSLKIKQKPLFEIKESVHKGLGMFATQNIRPGQVILREKPLIVMPDSIFCNDDWEFLESWMDKRLNKLSSQDREIFFDLADSRSADKTSLGIFFTNDMTYIDESAALFPIMARANHSCRPNSDFITRKNIGNY
jgi:hypothetical protein